MRIENTNVLDINKSKEHEIKEKTVKDASSTEKMSDGFWKDRSKLSPSTYSNPTVAGEGTVEDVKAEANGLNAELMKNQMLVSGNTTSSKDGNAIEDDGFSLHSTDVKTVITETDKIKMQLAKAGVDVSCMGDGLSKEKLEAMTGSVAMATQIEQSLIQADLPTTEENVKESIEAVDQANNMTDLTDGALKYLLDNQLDPTIENLYKAEYSGSSSYLTPADSNVNYDSMMAQIENVIEKSGLPVDENSIELSQFMIENDIAFTPENLSYLADLKQMTLPVDENKVMDAVTNSIQEGNRPKDAVLLDGYSLKDKAEETMEVIQNASDKDLKYITANGLELTVENLKQAALGNTTDNNQQNEGTTDPVLQIKDTDAALITARRQLEETRLAMTTQANYALLKQGIEIDTKPLEALVEDLKNTEKNYYAALLEQGGVPATDENVDLFAKTMDTVADLKYVPAYTLAIPSADTDTMDGLYKAGSALQETMKKANASYETLMTVPRKDLGDSIKKAFQNVDDILQDLDLDTSEENERAVRILAYNSQEITNDSILNIKACDEKVQQAFANLTPAVVREMIKKGVNPLDMNIEDLNVKAEEIKEDLDDSGSERFGEYLWKLEQNKDISPEERDTYIGIYRLLNQVEKTDGAAIGALVEQGAEVTMRNLLTNIRSMKHSNMDVSVDDNFGEIKELNTTGTDIIDQIETSYMNSCVKQSLDLLSPERLKTTVNQTDWQDKTPEELLSDLRNSDQVKETEESESYMKQQLQDFTVCMEASEDIYQVLSDYDIPNTMYNVMALQEMYTNRNGAFRQLFGDDKKDLDTAKEEMLKKYGEAIKTPEAMEEAQEDLEKTAEKVMDTMLVDHANVTSMKVKEMKLMQTQIQLSGKMAAQDETYAIPVLIENQITSVHLKVVRGEAEKGLINITFETDSLGKVAAEIKASDRGISGYVASDKADTVTKLNSQKESIEQALAKDVEITGENGEISSQTNSNLDFVESKSLDLTNFEWKEAVVKDGEKEVSKLQTATLYKMAENFIQIVKTL